MKALPLHGNNVFKANESNSNNIYLRSKRILEFILHGRVNIFCYPGFATLEYYTFELYIYSRVLGRAQQLLSRGEDSAVGLPPQTL